jgi:hypothetical protein
MTNISGKILRNFNYGNRMEELRLELICLCEVGSPSKSETGRRYGSISSTLFIMLKNKEKIQYILNLSKPILVLSFMSAYW